MVLRSPAMQKDMSSVDAVFGNEDLLMQILLCLPSKPLISFQCVSKQWLFLISDPEFRRRHTLRNHKSPPTALFYCDYDQVGSKCAVVSLKSYDEEEKQIPFMHEFLRHRHPVKPHYCNGLFCFGGRSNHAKFPNCFVCNTTTHQYKKLPPLHDRLGAMATSATVFNLAFDPHKSHQFRVVCVWECLKEKEDHSDLRYYFRISTYKSEASAWSESDEPPLLDGRFYVLDRGVYLNGCIHWVSTCTTRSFLRFDVEDECFKPMPSTPTQPHQITGRRPIRYFGEAGGHLYLIEKKYWSRDELMNVFQMENDYSKWFVKYRIDLDSPLMEQYYIFSLVIVEGSAGLVFSGPSGGANLIWCDLVHLTFRKLPQKLTLKSYRNNLSHRNTLHYYLMNFNWNFVSHYSETICSV